MKIRPLKVLAFNGNPPTWGTWGIIKHSKHTFYFESPGRRGFLKIFLQHVSLEGKQSCAPEHRISLLRSGLPMGCGCSFEAQCPTQSMHKQCYKKGCGLGRAGKARGLPWTLRTSQRIIQFPHPLHYLTGNQSQCIQRTGIKLLCP